MGGARVRAAKALPYLLVLGLTIAAPAVPRSFAFAALRSSVVVRARTKITEAGDVLDATTLGRRGLRVERALVGSGHGGAAERREHEVKSAGRRLERGRVCGGTQRCSRRSALSSPLTRTRTHALTVVLHIFSLTDTASPQLLGQQPKRLLAHQQLQPHKRGARSKLVLPDRPVIPAAAIAAAASPPPTSSTHAYAGEGSYPSASLKLSYDAASLGSRR